MSMTIDKLHSPADGWGSATVADAMGPADPQIAVDTMVDAALDILNVADADFLVLHGHDGLCVGLVTRAQFGPYRARSWYTERTAVSAIVHERGPFTRPGVSLSSALDDMRTRELRACPVVDDGGYALGVLTVAAHAHSSSPQPSRSSGAVRRVPTPGGRAPAAPARYVPSA
ncbi:CBS domain-containing protein [Streptomyces sp. NPDC058572]|uniref:CBS domain-containing protein n=1 Tax=Streptomyces sp. NPDC058572 TaxID=3346546 RepID=UPI00365AF05E